MRSILDRSRWVACALALAAAVPALTADLAAADGKRPSVADCTSFQQADSVGPGLDLTVASKGKARTRAALQVLRLDPLNPVIAADPPFYGLPKPKS